MAKKQYWNIKLIQTKSKKWNDGSYPICVVVRKEGQRKIISLKKSAHPHQWDEVRQQYQVDKRIKDLHPDRLDENEWLDDFIKPRCKEIIREFEEKRIDWTLNQFEEALINRTKRVLVSKYFEEHINGLKSRGNVGTASQYYYTMEMLKDYDKRFCARYFNEIDYRYITGFHNYFVEKRKVGRTTIKFYMKALRALLNKAIKNNDASAVTYPFGKDGYSISALDEETERRYLPSEYIEAIKAFKSTDFNLLWAKNLFLFSYYSQGMAIIDMGHLTKKNITKFESGDYIVYKRYKTQSHVKAKSIKIKISDNIRELLNWFKENTERQENYLLPVVSINGKRGAKLYGHVRNRARIFNKYLNKLAEELKFEGIKLTSYVSRHSYAMRLKNSGISEDIISEALGHKELSTTKTYLDSFQNDEVSKANEVL